jgi:hypothetical protein
MRHPSTKEAIPRQLNRLQRIVGCGKPSPHFRTMLSFFEKRIVGCRKPGPLSRTMR